MKVTAAARELPEGYVTVSQWVRRRAVCRMTISCARSMIASGRLPSIKYRGIRLVPKDAEPKAPLIRGQNPYINYAKAKA